MEAFHPMTTFRDHFSNVSSQYASFRPNYPRQLFDWLGSITPSRELAWDCGAGTGQASVKLADVFDRVIATDASRAQLEAATAHAKVEYRVAPAEESGLESSSADLVTVAQALHWFDLPRFYAEVRRVLKPRGVIAVWTYNLMVIDDGPIDVMIRDYYWNIAGPYWPAERRHVENGYVEFPFPFEVISPPRFDMTDVWTFDHVLGYIGTWSATVKLMDKEGSAKVEALAGRLRELWGDAEKREITWELRLRVGRV